MIGNRVLLGEPTRENVKLPRTWIDKPSRSDLSIDRIDGPSRRLPTFMTILSHPTKPASFQGAAVHVRFLTVMSIYPCSPAIHSDI